LPEQVQILHRAGADHPPSPEFVGA
jgi:hypothetical protein